MNSTESTNGSVYYTPQAALDAILANPPMGEPTSGTGALPVNALRVALRKSQTTTEEENQ